MGSALQSGWLLALTAALGSLERVDLGLLLSRSLRFYVRGEVTEAGPPLDGRIGAGRAELSGRKFDDPLTTFTLLHHRVARAPVETTPRLRHEGAFLPRLQRLAIHGDYLPFR